MLLTIKRVCANIIDIVLFFALLVMLFLHVSPVVSGFIANPTIAGVIVLLLLIAIITGIQYPFIKVHQTIGKAFFRLKIVSTNTERPLTVAIVLQRELFAKVASGYLLCFPVLLGKTGGHEIITETEVVSV
ncbi:MAG: RDD family protein [Defluviitaleaceae bacterium]|nr:RDD family protein [Defluviitaleaceae bacterium]